jgi:hypothetical protein
MARWWAVTPQPDHNTPGGSPQGEQYDAREEHRDAREKNLRDVELDPCRGQ